MRSLLLATLLVVSGPALGVAGGPDVWRDLPAAVRDRLHYTAADVPAFPDEDSTLLDVHNWFPVRVIDGVRYNLEFTAIESDVVDGPFRDLAPIKPGWNYGARYARAGSPPGSWTIRGPAYYWRSDSTLYERGYVTPAGWQVWQYFPGKGLRLAHYQISSGLNGGMALDEYFDTSGALVGVFGGSRFYWRGVAVDSKEFFAKKEELYRGAK